MYLHMNQIISQTHIDGVQELKFHYSLVKIPSIRRIVEPWKYKFKSKDE